MSDEYPWEDPQAVEAECNRCGETRLCLYLPDPFLAEIYPEDTNEPEWWCGTCYGNRHDEV